MHLGEMYYIGCTPSCAIKIAGLVTYVGDGDYFYGTEMWWSTTREELCAVRMDCCHRKDDSNLRWPERRESLSSRVERGVSAAGEAVTRVCGE
jgi:hypothetical protein